MSESSRAELAALLREPDVDLARAALLCCAEVEPHLDVEAHLARLESMGEQLAARAADGRGDAHAAAQALGSFLAGDLGFTGDTVDYHNPRNGLLTQVLERRRGLPITLSIIYVAVGQCAAMEVYGLNTPGHFLVGVDFDPGASPGKPAAVIDPFADGRVQRVGDFLEGLHDTGGAGSTQAALRTGVLEPAEPIPVVRRLLNNLTRDYFARGDAPDALWTVELKRLLPDTGSWDIEAHAQVLMQVGRYRDAARIVETYLEQEAGPDTDVAKLEAWARHARAQLN